MPNTKIFPSCVCRSDSDKSCGLSWPEQRTWRNKRGLCLTGIHCHKTQIQRTIHREKLEGHEPKNAKISLKEIQGGAYENYYRAYQGFKDVLELVVVRN